MSLWYNKDYKRNQLTVAKLIELLKDMPQNAYVFHDGGTCGGHGMVSGVRTTNCGEDVLLVRVNLGKCEYAREIDR